MVCAFANIYKSKSCPYMAYNTCRSCVSVGWYNNLVTLTYFKGCL